MSTHTPGPWTLDPAAETVTGIDRFGEVQIVVYELGTNQADARLIAAAPDLLEVLRRIADNKVALADRAYADSVNAYQLFARAAIAKATGEQS